MIEIETYAQIYPLALGAVFSIFLIAGYALLREKDDLHRLLLSDLFEVLSLVIIALIATDLAEALILPGMVVAISELLVISELYILKEGLYTNTGYQSRPQLEVLKTAPPYFTGALLLIGTVLSGFTGGVVAAVGILFYLLSLDRNERFTLIETISGYAWALWVVAFLIFLAFPDYWFFALMLAATAILVKVMTKLSLIGTMQEEYHE
jgi:energy-converting hydrogenase A subunit G